MLAGRGHAALLVEGEPAGLHVNLAACGSFGSRGHRGAFHFAAHCPRRSCLGRYGWRHAWPHQRNLHWPSGYGCARLLVILELTTFNAVHAVAVRAIQFDLHVMQQSVAFLELHNLRGVNLEERTAPMRLGVGDAVGLLLDFNAQPLRQVAAIEGVLPLAHRQKHHQRHQQQSSRHQH